MVLIDDSKYEKQYTSLLVVNRDTAESPSYHPGPGISHVIISISGTHDRAKLPKRNLCMDVLYLEFHDFDVDVDSKYPAFSLKQARQILKFFEKWRNKVNAILVHCDAGISRSPAVAAALWKIQGRDDSEYFRNYIPNRRVYSMILSEFYKTYKEE